MKRTFLLSTAAVLLLSAPAVAGDAGQSAKGASIHQPWLSGEVRPSLTEPQTLVGRPVLNENNEEVGRVQSVDQGGAGEPDAIVIEGNFGNEGDTKRIGFSHEELDVRGEHVVVKDLDQDGEKDELSIADASETPVLTVEGTVQRNPDLRYVYEDSAIRADETDSASGRQ